MSLIVEIFRNKDEKGYVIIEQRFTLWEWEELLKVAVNHGWKQEGTIKPNDADYHFFKPDYFPDYPFKKIVISSDAQAFGSALSKFYFSGNAKKDEDIAIELSAPTLIQENEGSLSIKKSGISKRTLEQFIRFLNEGEFYFWADD